MAAKFSLNVDLDKFELYGTKILVQNLAQANTEGFIFLENSNYSTYKQVKVSIVGNGVLSDGKIIKLDIVPGDKLIINSYNNKEKDFNINGEDYFLINFSDVIAIIRLGERKSCEINGGN